jgi:SAM-dependent methyltransferase
MIDRIVPSSPGTVLDVASGTAGVALQLASRTSAEVVGVDLTQAMLAQGHRNVADAAMGSRIQLVAGRAEQLPFPDGVFDAVMAQLVVHFMADPVAGLREMSRVTRPGGVVAACVWDHGGGRGPLTGFWRAVRELDPAAADESDLAGVRQGQLASLVARAGLGPAEASALTVRVRHASFEQWWEPFTLGVGPAGAYVASLTPERRDALREHCRHRLPAGPVDVSATAWAVTCRT